MKRTKIYVVLLLLVSVFILNSCKKDEKKTLSCDELATNYTAAALAFAFGPTEATCTAYEKAISDYLNGCGLLTAQEKADLQASLDENDCSQYGK